jgi:hypothetical protein
VLHVQYGCAFSAPEGWLNFDSSPTLRFERIPAVGGLYTKNRTRFPPSVRYGDVVSGLPVPAGSCRGVYASHVLEHLSLDDCRAALRETLRILGDGGIFRLVVPDLQVHAERYVAEARAGDAGAAIRFLDETFLGVRSRPRGPMGVARTLFGHSAHLWMWDEAGMRAELDRAGFSRIRRAQLGDCEDPLFAAVEDPERFVDACALEARR